MLSFQWHIPFDNAPHHLRPRHGNVQELRGLDSGALVAVEPCRPPKTNIGTETAFRHDHCKHIHWKSKHLRSEVSWYDQTRVHFQLLYSRKFSSAKNFAKSDRQAVRREFIFVKSRSSLVCSLLVRSSLFCLSFIFTFLNIFNPTLVVRNLI